jgi:hypothetical protein
MKQSIYVPSGILANHTSKPCDTITCTCFDPSNSQKEQLPFNKLNTKSRFNIQHYMGADSARLSKSQKPFVS